MPALPKTFLTPEQYLELEASSDIKNEYYNGEMFAMSGGSPNHSRIQLNLYMLLGAQLRQGPCEVFTSNLRVLVEEVGLYTYPDVSIACGERRFDAHDSLLNPTVIIEVLSPTTEAYDRGKKFDMYQQLESLREYVLVAQDELRVHLFTRQTDDTWVFRTFFGPTARVRLTSVDCEFALSDVYENEKAMDHRSSWPK